MQIRYDAVAAVSTCIQKSRKFARANDDGDRRHQDQREHKHVRFVRYMHHSLSDATAAGTVCSLGCTCYSLGRRL